MIHDPLTYYSTENNEEVWELSDEDSDVDEGLYVHQENVSEKPPPNPQFHDQTSTMENQKAQSIVRWIVGFLFILQSNLSIMCPIPPLTS